MEGSAGLTLGALPGRTATADHEVPESDIRMSAVTNPRVPSPAPTPPEPSTESGILSPSRMLLMALIAALVVFLIGATFDYILLHDAHDSRTTALEVSDALGGLIAGVLVYRLLQYERERRERLRQKLAIISDMNHHVRNALQVISFQTYSNADKEQLEAIRESMEHMQWALKEILPKL